MKLRRRLLCKGHVLSVRGQNVKLRKGKGGEQEMHNPKDTDANLLQKHQHQEAFSTSGVRRAHLFIFLPSFEFGFQQLCDKPPVEVARVQALQVTTSEFQLRNPSLLEHNAAHGSPQGGG